MNDEDKIRQVLYNFERSGLVEKNVDNLLKCISKHVLGIGLGEQGYVTSWQDVRDVFCSGLKSDDTAIYTVDYDRVEVLKPADNFAVVCATVRVSARPGNGEKKIIRSIFQQSLTVYKEGEDWKICGLHASTPIITEENIEAYPLKFAEKTLQSLREKIGEEVYLAEEQYRRAVLSDTIAFYTINFSENYFEKCQLQSDICAYVEPNTSYEQFVRENLPQYVYEDDIAAFLEQLSLDSIEKAFDCGLDEVGCEYRLRNIKGGYIWCKTIIRLLKDVITGAHKGIMYVKNIDEEKREEEVNRARAELDPMTEVLNKITIIQKTDDMLCKRHTEGNGVFLMIDVDDFKYVNDTYGHPVGDQVLAGIAALLREAFKPPALVGRLGGDEFGVFLYGERLNEELKARIELLLGAARRFGLPEFPALTLSISIGAACLDLGRFEDYYQAADSALYRAKRMGKNAVVYNYI